MLKRISAGMTSCLLFSALAMLTFTQGTLQAQEKSSDDQSKPKTAEEKADEVLKKYIEATGGRKTYEAVKNAKFKGELSIPAAGIKGVVEIAVVMPEKMSGKIAPDSAKFYFKADIGSLGMQERGCNGKVVWENSTAQGPRLIEGDEAEQVLHEIALGSILNPKNYYKEIKLVDRETIGEVACNVIELTKKNGEIDKDYYSIESGLKVKSVKNVETPLGKIAVETLDSNYKKSKNGLTTAWTSEQKVGPNSVFMKMESVEFNVDMGDQKFELPKEVKELLDK